MIPGTDSTPAAIVRAADSGAAAVGFLIAARTSPAGTTSQMELVLIDQRRNGVVLLPGWGLVFFYGNNGVGSTLDPTWWWYERVLEEAERTA